MAAANTVYLLFKNKFTEEWEFPTKPMVLGESFQQSKKEFFETIADNWRIQLIGRSP